MKKQLLLILALLAFILPARAEQGVDPYMLYNFRNNDKATDYGTNFGTSVALTNVFATVVGNDVTSFGIDNAPDYVGAITEASNVSYNSKGGIYMKAGGKFTFTLKKSYKVKEYQFMGRQANGTTATVTVNGVSFEGPTATIESGTFSRLYLTPASPTEINAITISSDKDVFIKSIGIYVEAEEAKHKVIITPPQELTTRGGSSQPRAETTLTSSNAPSKKRAPKTIMAIILHPAHTTSLLPKRANIP